MDLTQMIRIIVVISAIILLLGCQSNVIDDIPKPQRANHELILEPVKFNVVIHDDVVYYALTSDNYINLSINMVRMQQLIYNMAVWEKLNNERIESIEDHGNSAVKD